MTGVLQVHPSGRIEMEEVKFISIVLLTCNDSLFSSEDLDNLNS